MTLKDIKKAINQAIKSKYPKHPCYGVDTVEGYKRPSFFVLASETPLERTKNAAHKNVEVEIQYIQNSPDESKAMEFFSAMEEVFGSRLAVENRNLSVATIYQDFAGEHGEVPIFGFTLDFWVAIEKPKETAPLMGQVILRQEEK